MEISVVIPMYNEAGVIGQSAQTLWDTLNRDFGAGHFEILFVSDGSSDGCDGIISNFAAEHDAVRLIAYTPNRGKGYAVRQGMLAAKGDLVLFTDSDLAYGTDIIKVFYDSWKKNGYDVLIGSRAMAGGGYDSYTFLRKFMSKAYLKVIGVAAGFHHSDSQAGLKAFSGEYAHRIFSLCQVDRFAFDLEALMIADRMKCRIGEIPAKVLNHGESKVSPVKDALNMLSQVRKIKKRVRELPL
ncbi:MAG: glycosyltransferase [Eubacteriales bacterium]